MRCRTVINWCRTLVIIAGVLVFVQTDSSTPVSTERAQDLAPITNNVCCRNKPHTETSNQVPNTGDEAFVKSSSLLATEKMATLTRPASSSKFRPADRSKNRRKPLHQFSGPQTNWTTHSMSNRTRAMDRRRRTVSSVDSFVFLSNEILVDRDYDMGEEEEQHQPTYEKAENGSGYLCHGVTDIFMHDQKMYFSTGALPPYRGEVDKVDILIQNRSSCERSANIRVSTATVLNLTVETCCITWCTHELEIIVEQKEQVLLNFLEFNVPGLNVVRSEAIGVCDDSLTVAVDYVNKQTRKTHVIGSFCGIKEAKTVFVEHSRAKIILKLKDNAQCVDKINFLVQIIPCLKFQYDKCDSTKYVHSGGDRGFVSSPGLADGQNYPNDIQCEWNITVSEGKLIRLKPEDIQLREGDMIQVFPKSTDSRQFPTVLKLSNSNFRYPIVLPSNECVLEFHSDSLKSGIGFNISYQGVDEFRFIPMYDNQSLDCSNNIEIPNDMMCNYYVDCANGEDEDRCYYKVPGCWPRGYAVRGQCYQVVHNQPSISWTMAEEFCERNLSSHLVTITTTTQKRFVDKFIKFLGPSLSVIFLGLQRMRMQQVPQMYRRMWQWTDGTAAFYLPDEYRYEGWSTCSVYHGNYFHSTDCGALKENVSFICERQLKDLEMIESKDSETINVSTWNPGRTTPINGMIEKKISVFQCHSGEYISIEQRCDKVGNCFDRSDELDCDYEYLADTMFSCDTQGLLAYTFVCDGIDGCLDSSDEKSCAGLDKTVLGPQLTTCTDGMIVERSKLCDAREDCRDASDEEDCNECVAGSALCPMIACLPRNWQNDTEVDCPIRDLKGRRAPESVFKENLFKNRVPPGIVVPDGYGKFEIKSMTGELCPPTHAQCSEGYCIPVYMWCNNMVDCPNGEDERPELCEKVCVGMYRCKYTHVCVHSNHLCDGYYQCPNHDDELLCSLQNISCPQNCKCSRMEVTCSSYPVFESATPVRYLRLQNTDIPDLRFKGIALYSLIYLNVSSSNVRNIRREYLNYINLKIIDIRHNHVEYLPENAFMDCHSLKVLVLSHNRLNNVRFSFLQHTRELTKLDLSYNIKNTLEDGCFYAADKLEELILQFMQISTIAPKAFSGFIRLKRLDLKGNELVTFSMDIFSSQKNLRSIVTDNFRLCCPTIKPSSVQFSDCDAPYDEISSCEDILRTLLLRVALWLMAMLTITGNFGVIVYRIFYDRGIKYSFRIIITCLSASDLIMGIYLVIIGSADMMYRDRYLLAEREWKTSVPCQVAGFLCLLSSETSALFILLVTVDRLLAIAFPLHPALHFNAKSATVGCILVWAIGLFMATIPLLPPFQHWELYSQKAVGVPLPITRLHFPGYDYAFAIFILFNMAVFLLVAMGQVLIYLSVHLQKHPQISEARVKQDTAIAKRLVLVVITDCLCWFPITVMGLAARSGQPVPGEMYLVTTVFLLPANSAFNPFLYTANAILLARRNRRKKKAEDLYELRQLSQ
ncbi:unnamed protein product [Candidula unifasciata]|uniref:G-protein coupled receptor GRL101 n=1 Tax=Candidula unifasciata TaxID=100452 RepID=A0A8S3ZJ81_9EUPU|nr:unnamed protein product [Candidula unifasciata]